MTRVGCPEEHDAALAGHGHPPGCSPDRHGVAAPPALRAGIQAAAPCLGIMMSGEWGTKDQPVEDSLRLLGTDWIDVYQVHHYDPSVDLEVTLDGAPSRGGSPSVTLGVLGSRSRADDRRSCVVGGMPLPRGAGLPGERGNPFPAVAWARRMLSSRSTPRTSRAPSALIPVTTATARETTWQRVSSRTAM